MSQQPDTKPGAYYVTVADGSRVAILVGPFIDDHAGALALVDKVRKVVETLDPRGAFYSYGTSRLPNDGSVALPRGRLNAHVGV